MVVAAGWIGLSMIKSVLITWDIPHATVLTQCTCTCMMPHDSINTYTIFIFISTVILLMIHVDYFLYISSIIFPLFCTANYILFFIILLFTIQFIFYFYSIWVHFYNMVLRAALCIIVYCDQLEFENFEQVIKLACCFCLNVHRVIVFLWFEHLVTVCFNPDFLCDMIFYEDL